MHFIGPTGRVWGISLPDGAKNEVQRLENGTDRQLFVPNSA